MAPTPSRGRPPLHQKMSGLKSLGLYSFFVPERGQECWPTSAHIALLPGVYRLWVARVNYERYVDDGGGAVARASVTATWRGRSLPQLVFTTRDLGVDPAAQGRTRRAQAVLQDLQGTVDMDIETCVFPILHQLVTRLGVDVPEDLNNARSLEMNSAPEASTAHLLSAKLHSLLCSTAVQHRWSGRGTNRRSTGLV